MPLFSIITILTICFARFDFGTWWPQWAILMGWLGLFFGLQVAKTTHLICGIAASYTILQSLFVVISRQNAFQKFGAMDRLNIYYGTFYALQAFILIVFWACSWTRGDLKWIARTFGLVCLIDSLYVLYQYDLPPHLRGGLLDYPGMNGCFIAMTWPLLWKCAKEFKLSAWRGWIVWGGLMVIPVLAVFMSNGSMPIGVLAAVIVTYVVRKYGTNWKWLLGMVGVVGAIGGLGLLLFGEMFFHSAERFTIYQKSYDWIHSGFGFKMKVFSEWFGVGNGTYITFGPVINAEPGAFGKIGTLRGLITWAHSDFFQTYWEMGKTGVIIYGILFVGAAWNFWKRNQIFHLCCLAGWLACALFDYPVHLAVTAVLGTFLIREAYVNPKLVL